MQSNILSQLSKTTLGTAEYMAGSMPSNTKLGPTTYVTGSTQPKTSLLEANQGTTYSETAFKNASVYRPPILRPVFELVIGGAGQGVSPGMSAPTLPPIGYFQYQGSVTYFDVSPGGTEYYITQ